MNSLSNMPKDIINKMFLFMTHPTADIFRDSCICSSCKSFNNDKYRKYVIIAINIFVKNAKFIKGS